MAVEVVRKDGGNQAADRTGPDIMATGPERPLRNWPRCIQRRICQCADSSQATGQYSAASGSEPQASGWAVK